MPKRLPHVLLCADTLAPTNSGIGRVARAMARTLAVGARDGAWKVTAIGYSDQPPEHGTAGRDTTGWDHSLGIRIIRTGGSKLRYLLAAHMRAFPATHLIFDSPSMARARPWIPGFRRPSLTFIHGIEVWEEARPDHLAAAKGSDWLVSNTVYTRGRAHELHGGFDRAIVCPLSTESDFEPPARDTTTSIFRLTGETRPFNVVSIGRLEADSYKGFPELIQAWPAVVAQHPDARLQILGRGPGLAGLRELAERLGVAEQVELPGFVPDEELPRYLREATVFAMPSRGEGFGLVYIEAMRQGLPCIAGKHDAAKEVVVDGTTGRLVDPDQADEVRDAILAFANDRKAAREMGEAGQDRWRRLYRPSAFQQRFRTILDAFLAGDPPTTVPPPPA